MLSVSNFSITHRHSLRFLGLVLCKPFFFFCQIKGVVLEPERCNFRRSHSLFLSFSQFRFAYMLNV